LPGNLRSSTTHSSHSRPGSFVTAVNFQLADALRDRYVFEKQLGRGGMATVYLARDLRHDRAVAIKVMHPQLAASLGPERFLVEIRTAARLQHPHILPVHDSGEAAGLLWYTMPFIEGESLRDRLKRDVQLPVEEAVRLTKEVAEALDYAHSQGVVHRDIKPENILLSRGHALLADFGIAKAAAAGGQLTGTGLIVGTPTYMSPEQASGNNIDGRADLYSLGCVLYEMLAGEPPYTGPTPQAIAAKRFVDPIPSIRRVRQAVPPQLEAVLTRALAAVPADRFASASDLAQALSTASARRLTSEHWDRRQGVARLLRGSVLGGMVIGIVVAIGYLMRHYQLADDSARSPTRSASLPTPRDSVAALPSRRSIVVLPLVNIGGDPADEYFSDGMTDELTGALSKLPGLRVASRTSAFRFKGRKDVDVRAIGEELSVGTVLEGSVRRFGTKLRMTAQLISVSDGFAVWSESYERDLQDVLRVQVEVAQSVADALELTLGASGKQAIASLGTQNVKAHDLYLRGRFILWRNTEKDIRRSLDFFQAAQQEDPTYAPPHAGTAQAWMMLADDFVAPREAWPKVRMAALRALELDSASADAHTLLGAVLQWYEKDLTGAERELRLAMTLNPNDANTRFNLGRLLVLTGRASEGLDEYRRAIALDPLSAIWVEELARALVWAGQVDAAMSTARQALALDPDLAITHEVLGNIHFAKGALEPAGLAYRQAEQLGWTNASFGRAMVHAASGHPDSARQIAQQWEVEAARRWVAPDLIAGIYAALGEHDKAFRLLEQAYQKRAGYLLMLHVRPDLMSLRGDPRFTSLARKLGLIQRPREAA